MATSSKFVKLTPTVLMQWSFDSENFISENYKVITNLNENKKRSFLSTTGLNRKEQNLVQIDPIVRKYAVMSSDINYLQEQDYSSPPVQYDNIKVYLPTSYNFTREGYVGFYVKIYAYNFENNKIYELSNIFYDNTNPKSGSTLINLAIPFIYDEREWGKYFEFQIPSIDYISNQRYSINSQSITLPNSINYNLTNGEGLSRTAPIFIEFRFITSKDTIYNTNYFYLSDEYRVSIPKAPEFQTLAVKIEEADTVTEGDYFKIYGVYAESNENMDNFIQEMEDKGRTMRLEYDVYVYEENLQTSKQTFSIDDMTLMSQKIKFRPILTTANTTAAIKVTMKVIDLNDMSQIERFATLGIRETLHKYGRKLISLDVQNMNSLKIYNAKPEQIQLNRGYTTQAIKTEIVKVLYPQLIDVGKIIANSPRSSRFYKGMGLLNIIINPFDNIIQFRIAELGDNNQLVPYNLADVLIGSELKLVFKSDTETIEKSFYHESENNFTLGIINYKIEENDIKVIKTIYDKGYDNFYLVVDSNKTKTLLYSGTFTFFEDVRFVDDGSNQILDDSSMTDSGTSGTSGTSGNIGESGTYDKLTLLIYTKYKYAQDTGTSSETLPEM